MQTCEKKRRDLVLYLYRELNEVEQADLLAHLQVCPDCRAELQELSKL
ncbi:MAG: anti-sigma factor, partial [Zetaproteobacteria bacterium CG02_land_8_20_14_3_00_50_9]